MDTSPIVTIKYFFNVEVALDVATWRELFGLASGRHATLLRENRQHWEQWQEMDLDDWEDAYEAHRELEARGLWEEVRPLPQRPYPHLGAKFLPDLDPQVWAITRDGSDGIKPYMAGLQKVMKYVRKQMTSRSRINYRNEDPTPIAQQIGLPVAETRVVIDWLRFQGWMAVTDYRYLHSSDAKGRSFLHLSMPTHLAATIDALPNPLHQHRGEEILAEIQGQERARKQVAPMLNASSANQRIEVFDALPHYLQAEILEDDTFLNRYYGGHGGWGYGEGGEDKFQLNPPTDPGMTQLRQFVKAERTKRNNNTPKRV